VKSRLLFPPDTLSMPVIFPRLRPLRFNRIATSTIVRSSSTDSMRNCPLCILRPRALEPLSQFCLRYLKITQQARPQTGPALSSQGRSSIGVIRQLAPLRVALLHSSRTPKIARVTPRSVLLVTLEASQEMPSLRLTTLAALKTTEHAP
jgi:hypothetical protein